MVVRSICDLKILIILLIVSGPIKALPVNEISGLYSQFRPEFQHFSPINGLLILYSGILANIRFHGFYGSQKNILCHYQIVNPPEGVPSGADRDCPQDYTTAIIQQLFPSPAGGQLSLPGPKYDFFNVLPFDKLGELLKTYHHAKQSPQQAFEEFQRLFRSWILDGKVLNKNGRKSLANLWGKSDKNILTRLVNDYATIFAHAIAESDDYPLNFVESALLAFICQRALSGKDLEPFFKVFDGYLLPSSKMTQFSEEIYNQWKEKFLIDHKITPSQFTDLLRTPETLIFATLAYEIYDRLYPQMLGTGTAIHTYLGANAEQKKESFSDCGESSLRNFFNVMLADPETKSFNVEHLQNTFPKASSKLIQFYQLQPTYNYVTNDLKIRSSWADVVSSLNQSDDPELVTYGGTGRCNIKGIGVDNILIVLAKVLNDPSLGKPVNDQHRGQMITYLLRKFSRDGIEFSWHVEGKNTELPPFVDLTIQVNGDDQFVWQFHQGHYVFDVIGEQEEATDWRRNQPFVALKLMGDDDLNPLLKHHLLPFYIGIETRELLLEKNYQNRAQHFVPELVYGASLNGGEHKLGALDLGLTLNPKIINKLAPVWLSNFHDDPMMNRMVAGFIAKYKDLLLNKNHQRLDQVYSNTLHDFNKLTPRIFDGFDSPYAEFLLIDILKGKTANQITQAKNNWDQTLLHKACEYNYPNLVSLLLQRAGDNLLSYEHIKDAYGFTPLHKAIEHEHFHVVQILLNNPQVVQAMFDLKNIKTTEGLSPLHFAARSNQGETILSMLLNNQELRIISLMEGNLKNNIGQTPLHEAIDQETDINVRLLFADKEVKEILLKNHNIVDRWGFTPLHMAATFDRHQIIDTLIHDPESRAAMLADKNWLTKSGQSPVDCARSPKLKEVLKQTKNEFDRNNMKSTLQR